MWESVNLGDYCDFEGGNQPPKSKFLPEPKEGYIRLLQIRDFKSDDKAVYIPVSKKNRTCESTDIMIGRYGASVGQIHRGKAGAYNVALIKTIPNKDKIDNDFFYYYLNSDTFQKPLASVSARSAQAGFSKADIYNFQLPLPPLEEQKRIVAILDEAFAGIDQAIANTQQNIQNARELFESYLNTIFTQKGEGWEESAIEKICTLKSGTSLKKDLEKDSGDIPYVKVADMYYEGNERGIVGSSRYVTFNDVSPNSIFPVGSVIFPKRGGAIATNKKRITEVEICADLNIMAVWSDGELNNEYLYYYFKSVDMAKLGSGTTIPQINNYDIAPLVICYPKNKSEQDQIVSNLSVVEAETNSLISVYEEKFSALKELKQSLLQKAFAGELTSDLSEAA